MIYTITFSFAYNYGAILQMYALIEFLNRNSYRTEGIDYWPEYKIKKEEGFKARIIHLLTSRRRHKFRIFSRKYIPKTQTCKSMEDILKMKQPEIYIAGSDQIWNKDLLGRLDDAFFLNFDTKAKKVFYAASIGKNKISDIELKEIIEKIGETSIVSVREHFLQKKLSEIGMKDVYTVLDPVFLLTRQDYSKLAKTPKEKKYILVYQMQFTEKTYEIAALLKKKYNLKIIELGRMNRQPSVDRVVFNAGPAEFLGWIYNAEYIITNSFHGTAFSIILEKQFFVAGLSEKVGIRIRNLLEQLELETQIYEDKKNVLKRINYTKVNSILDRQIGKSKDFLISAIKEEQVYDNI